MSKLWHLNHHQHQQVLSLTHKTTPFCVHFFIYLFGPSSVNHSSQTGVPKEVARNDDVTVHFLSKSTTFRDVTIIVTAMLSPHRPDDDKHTLQLPKQLPPGSVTQQTQGGPGQGADSYNSRPSLLAALLLSEPSESLEGALNLLFCFFSQKLWSMATTFTADKRKKFGAYYS